MIVEIVFVFCFHFWSSETVGYSILLTCSNTLDNITQGPHHVAKKSMTMVFSLLDIATSSSWVVSFCTCDKKKRKQNKKQFKKQQERLGSSKTIKQFSSSSTFEWISLSLSLSLSVALWTYPCTTSNCPSTRYSYLSEAHKVLHVSLSVSVSPWPASLSFHVVK